MRPSPSILNEVLGPVMRGPSSSHTAGAHRIGRLIHDMAGGTPVKVTFQFHPKGSLATTFNTQGSDIGLAAGLLDMEMTDARMPKALEIAQNQGLHLKFEVVDFEADHPNTYKCRVTPFDGAKFSCIALSTGGGMIRVVRINNEEVYFQGDSNIEIDISGKQRTLRPVLPVPEYKGNPLPITDARSLLDQSGSLQLPLSDLAISYESARSGLSTEVLNQIMSGLLSVWRTAIKDGLEGTRYADRLVGSQSPIFEKRRSQNQLISAGPLNRMLSYSTAIMEVKSSMGVIVAAPTAGAAGGLPGCLFGYADECSLEDEKLINGFWAAGLIGMFIARDATFAAEVAGCQAETGAGSAMASAGLVNMAGGNAKDALSAASLAIQNLMGLICDPVANRVEIPCLGRNAQAASNALTCANLALGGVDAVIPLDEAIITMLEVGKAMPHELRCTALGGLSLTNTAKKLENELARKKKDL